MYFKLAAQSVAKYGRLCIDAYELKLAVDVMRNMAINKIV